MSIITAISFDYGLQNIGVAYGQRDWHRQELPPLNATDGVPNWQQVAKLFAQWQPDIAIVGLPLNMDDSEQLSTRARKFGRRLHGCFTIPVEFMDGDYPLCAGKRKGKRTQRRLQTSTY